MKFFDNEYEIAAYNIWSIWLFHVSIHQNSQKVVNVTYFNCNIMLVVYYFSNDSNYNNLKKLIILVYYKELFDKLIAAVRYYKTNRPSYADFC